MQYRHIIFEYCYGKMFVKYFCVFNIKWTFGHCCLNFLIFKYFGVYCFNKYSEKKNVIILKNIE